MLLTVDGVNEKYLQRTDYNYEQVEYLHAHGVYA